jgi:hypothetical protein
MCHAAKEKFVMDALTKGECTAPPGQFRLVIRDHMDSARESVGDDHGTLEIAKEQASHIRGPAITAGAYERTVYVFDDKGEVVHEEG